VLSRGAGAVFVGPGVTVPNGKIVTIDVLLEPERLVVVELEGLNP
jgi:hypothetical protein